jgi:energy-converting hydrogenase Eha subunit C
MKIVEETRTRLQLKHRPINKWFSGACIVIGCLGFLIYCIFFEFASARLTCHRPAPNQLNCELRRSNLLGITEKLRIFDLQEAYVKINRGSKGSKNYQVIIVTPLRDYQLISNLSYRENQQVAQEINYFVLSENRSLSVQQNQRNFLFFLNLFILIIMAIGAFLATSPVSKCTFYKSLNQVCIERKGWRGQTIIEEPLETILRFDIQAKQFKYAKLYRAVIVLQSDKEIPINSEYTNEQSIRYAVSRINSFLNYQ